MHRREFVRAAALATAAAGVVAGCGPGPGARRRGAVGERRPVRWRLASSFTRSLDTLYGTAERFTDRVGALTGGAFEIRPYQGGELVPALEVLEAVQNQSVEMGHTASYYYIGRNAALAFDSTVPFGLTARQQNAWLYHGGGLDLVHELLADFNIVSFPGGNTGVQMGGWFREPIGSLQDLHGVKMRIPGLGGEVMDRLGVTVQVLAGGDVYVALERGAIDAAEWVGPYDDMKLGLDQVAKNYYYPGWWEPGSSISFYVNRTAWDGLPEEYRQAIAVAAAEANVDMMALYDVRNATALQTLVAGGVELRPFSDDIMAAARNASEDIMKERAASDAAYRKIYTSFAGFREQAFRWFSRAEQEYARFAFGSNSDGA